ncbi:MAG: hypothetical protein HN368_19865, partial [Spirochaetales bacterium]|nr:hypothetical protein [Spirochaetales bacterium]
GTVHRTIRLLQEALEELKAPVPLATLEFIGVMVNRAMSAQERSLHTPEHIFGLVEPGDPHINLAALFHDIVYYQVDQGFTPKIEEIVSPYIRINDSVISIVDKVKPDDRAFWGCASVFGYVPGQVLSPFNGLNEFLSALVMDCLLEGAVQDRDLLETTACIEATIPFRGFDENGLSPADSLEHRIELTNTNFSLGLTKENIQHIVKSAVMFANKDVANFSEVDVGKFLDNTWKLLPESNPSLRVAGMYSIGNYRTALQKMEGFLRTLNPDAIYAKYLDSPPIDEYHRIVDLAQRNLVIAREYLGVKLLAAAVLEALANVSGGDAPISLFMGDLKADGQAGRLADLLPKPKSKAEKNGAVDQILYDLLAFGRASSSSFDLNNSPLALHIYLEFGTRGFHKHLETARKMADGNLSPADFLNSLPRKFVSDLAHASGEMVFTRKEALDEFVRSQK